MSHPSPGARPVFVVHSLAQAQAALSAAAEAGRPISLLSGGYLAWSAFQALCAAAREAVPSAEAALIFDPGERGGFAAEALSGSGAAERPAALVFPARHPQRALLENLTAQAGILLLPPIRRTCDLAGAKDPLAASRAWLASRRR